MKRFSLLAAATAALTFSSMAVSADRFEVAADCKKVTKTVSRVCNTYNAHKASLEAIRDQLHADKLSIKDIRTHTQAVEGVFKAIRAKKSKRDVKGKITAVTKTSKPVMKQVKPLARKYSNYRTMLQDLTITKDRFEASYTAWLAGDTSPVGTVKCKKVKKNAFKVCSAYKKHSKDLAKVTKQLAEDKLSTRNTDAHADALADVFKAVAANKTVKVVDARVKSLALTSKGVQDQLAPLARKHANYRELLADLKKSSSRFDKALKTWKKSKTSDDDADDFDDADDADDVDDTDDSDDSDDFDDR